MKHVAQAAGVSVMTVSLALRHAPSIPVATRARVLAAAEKLGYRRNPLVSVLMAGLRGRGTGAREAQVLAYVESFPPGASGQHVESLRRFREGSALAAARHGYRLEVFRLGGSGLSEVRLERVLQARGIRGVVFAPVPKAGTRFTQAWAGHAVAALGFSITAPAMHRSVNHQIHSIRLALRSLLALGYRRIGLVISRAHNERVEHRWLSSVLLTQYEHRATGAVFPLRLDDDLRAAPVRAWMRREAPEVVVTTEPQIARLVGSSCHFAHLDLTAAAPGCAGIDQNGERVGAAAVDLVVEQLHANEFGLPQNPKTVLIEGRWVAGKTAPGPGHAMVKTR